MTEDMRAVCGVDCSKCDVYMATINDDNELWAKCLPGWQKTAKKHWRTELELNDINCKGCIQSEEAIFSPTYCPMPYCAREKRVTSCGQCPDWKTCGWLQGLLADEPQAREYLENQQ